MNEMLVTRLFVYLLSFNHLLDLLNFLNCTFLLKRLQKKVLESSKLPSEVLKFYYLPLFRRTVKIPKKKGKNLN